MTNHFRKLAAALLGLALSTGALAQGKGLDEPFRDGYKKALAHLHTLQKREKSLEHDRSKLIDLMTRA